MPVLIIAILSGLLSLFYFQTAAAEITIDGETLHVETDGYEVRFDRGVITQIYNKRISETYTLSPDVNRSPGFTLQTGILGKNLWARYATKIVAKKINSHQAEILFRGEGYEIRLLIAVDSKTDDLLISGDCISDTPSVHGMMWGIENLDLNNLSLILPSESGQIIEAESAERLKTFHYPSSKWEAQLAIIQAERGGFYVRGTDETFQFKELTYQSDANSFGLGFQTHNQAPWDTLTSARSITWRLNTYSGNWCVPAEIYRDWMEAAFSPWTLSDIPAWVGDIGLVIIHTNLDTKMLERLAKLIDPTKTLIYLTAWRTHRHDVNYPNYTAKDEFGRFVEFAHRLGYRVMPHVNLFGISPYHPLYPEFQKFQLRHRWGELAGWKWDETDNPQRHAFINLANSKFRSLLIERWKMIWEQYDIDAFHLDVSHLVVNDANGLVEGLNSAQGNVLMHKELAEAMPGVVFSGESLHEVTFFRENFAQRGAYEAKAHPISAFLFTPYTISYGHLGVPFLEYETTRYHTFLNAYEGRGILPTLRIWNEEGLDGHFTQQMLSVARQWQNLGLRPDFGCDWGPDILFQYSSRTGETVTYQRTPSGSVLVLPNDAGYERVFGATQAQTDRSLPHWRAYNDTQLIGLDPNRYYFLDNAPRDSAQLHINALSPDVYISETRITDQAALFRLEKNDVPLEMDLLAKLHSARTGIVVNGTELPLQRGGTFRDLRSTLSGVTKSAIHAHPFYQDGSGDTFGEFMIPLPDSPNIRLEFHIGLREGSEKSDGVTFIVSVQDNEIFRQHYNQQRWEPVNLDLSLYRDQIVKLRFTTTPGPNGDTGWDWAVWGEPKIISAPDTSLKQIGFFSPVEPIASLPDTLSHIGGEHYSLKTGLPAQILFFLAPGQQVVPPYDLRETQFITGLQFDGIFRLGSIFDSGNRRTVENPNGERKPSIFAHPPTNGQTILQFPLHLPESRGLIFSFSMVLQDNPCSNGVLFQVVLNGHKRVEHLIETPDWVDMTVPLSELAGQPVLLELVTDTNGNSGCDWAHWADLLITAEEPEPNGDINQDGVVNILDMIVVAQNFGQKPPADPRADANKDGQVNILDLVFVAERLGENVAAAPSQMDVIRSIPSTSKEIIAIQRALRELEAVPDKSPHLKVAIELLRHYLSIANQSVQETKLLPNYPNPFNPETWVPYQLSKEATVTVKIYDVSGHLVRTIEVGHKPVGYYLTRERAVYWDGRNENGESVGSGVYFYTLNADRYTETRRLVIVK